LLLSLLEESRRGNCAQTDAVFDPVPQGTFLALPEIFVGGETVDARAAGGRVEG
jgi:hypothetical protein